MLLRLKFLIVVLVISLVIVYKLTLNRRKRAEEIYQNARLHLQ